MGFSFLGCKFELRFVISTEFRVIEFRINQILLCLLSEIHVYMFITCGILSTALDCFSWQVMEKFPVYKSPAGRSVDLAIQRTLFSYEAHGRGQ